MASIKPKKNFGGDLTMAEELGKTPKQVADLEAGFQKAAQQVRAEQDRRRSDRRIPGRSRRAPGRPGEERRQGDRRSQTRRDVGEIRRLRGEIEKGKVVQAGQGGRDTLQRNIPKIESRIEGIQKKMIGRALGATSSVQEPKAPKPDKVIKAAVKPDLARERAKSYQPKAKKKARRTARRLQAARERTAAQQGQSKLSKASTIAKKVGGRTLGVAGAALNVGEHYRAAKSVSSPMNKKAPFSSKLGAYVERVLGVPAGTTGRKPLPSERPLI